MVLNIHNSQFPRPLHFFRLCGTTQGNGSLIIFDAAVRSVGERTLVCEDSERGVRAQSFIFFSRLFLFFLEDRKINENNSYKTEPILGLFWSLWIFGNSVFLCWCFSAWHEMVNSAKGGTKASEMAQPVQVLVAKVGDPSLLGIHLLEWENSRKLSAISPYALCQGVSVVAPSKQMSFPLFVHELWFSFLLP